MDLYPDEIDPLSSTIIKLHGASKISDQRDMAEIVGVPWMKRGHANTLMRRKARERLRLLEGDDSMVPVPEKKKIIPSG